MRRFIQIMFFLFAFIFANEAYADKKVKIIKVTVEPKEAAIYINNTFSGYGYAEFTKPKKKNEVVIIRCECEEYKEVLTKFYGGDKRQSISLKLQQDGFYRSSASSGIVNKFFTIDIDKQYYTEKDGMAEITPFESKYDTFKEEFSYHIDEINKEVSKRYNLSEDMVVRDELVIKVDDKVLQLKNDSIMKIMN